LWDAWAWGLRPELRTGQGETLNLALQSGECKGEDMHGGQRQGVGQLCFHAGRCCCASCFEVGLQGDVGEVVQWRWQEGE
jgi:hypothetical protein